MSDGEREFRAERAKRLELLGGMDSARKGKGAINSSLAFLKKAAQDVGEILEEADAGAWASTWAPAAWTFGATLWRRSRPAWKEKERSGRRGSVRLSG